MHRGRMCGSLRGEGGAGRRLMLLVSAVAVVSVLGVVAAQPSGSVAPVVGGLLVVEQGQPSPRVTILTLAGRRLPVPARVREFPFGLSPDARLVAAVSADGVLIGPVRGGSMNSVLRGSCASSPCPYGSDPSYAWSPDSQRLAAAASPLHGPTLLKLFNRSGQMVRSFTLPQGDPAHGARVYHHLLPWSPDGSRLLLLRSNDYGPTAAVVLDIEAAKLRTLAPMHFCSEPSLAWSPDARLVALAEQRVCQDGPSTFSVMDAARARRIVQCADRPACSGGTVWARDSGSLFGTVINKGASRIDRFYLAGHRTTVIESSASQLTPQVALATGLVYQANPSHGHAAMYLHHFATGRRDLLISSESTMAVRPLAHLP